MKKFAFAMLLVPVILLTGCIPISLFPLYTDETIVYDPALIGKFQNLQDEITYEFSDSGNNGYNLLVTHEDGTTESLTAHLVDLKGKLFLDIEPVETESGSGNFLDVHLFPVHSCYMIEEIGSVLKVVPLDTDWCRRYIEEHPFAVKHQVINDRMIITAETKKLRHFLGRMIDNDEMFLEYRDYPRVLE